MSRVIPISLLLILLSCKNETKKLWWTKPSTDNFNDFLFLAESSNLIWLVKDSLSIYLTESEIQEIESVKNKTVTSDTWKEGIGYENHGQIIKTEKFKLILLLKTDNTAEYRNYTFILRTYDKRNKIIDYINIAKWNEVDNIFCYGSIDENLEIETGCGVKKYIVSKEGKFKIKN